MKSKSKTIDCTNVTGASKLLGVSRQQVYYNTSRGYLRSAKNGPYSMIPLEDIARMTGDKTSDVRNIAHNNGIPLWRCRRK